MRTILILLLLVTAAEAKSLSASLETINCVIDDRVTTMNVPMPTTWNKMQKEEAARIICFSLKTENEED
jgi:hypothetical protein